MDAETINSSQESSPDEGSFMKPIEVKPRRQLRSSGEVPSHSPERSPGKRSPAFKGFPKYRPESVIASENFRSPTPVPPPPPPKAEPESGSAIKFILLAAIIILSLLISKFSDSEVLPGEKPNCTEFMTLVKSYPNQDKKLFKSLKAGAEALVIPGDPSVFSFFSTEQQLMQDLMEKIVKITKKCIHQHHEPLILTKDQINERVIETYKDQLEKSSIMVIENLHEASIEGLQHLHSFCDTYSPLVPRSIIFLTIKVPQKPPGKPVDYITRFLEEKWAEMKDNVRGPLITRILDQTFFIEPR